MFCWYNPTNVEGKSKCELTGFEFIPSRTSNILVCVYRGKCAIFLVDQLCKEIVGTYDMILLFFAVMQQNFTDYRHHSRQSTPATAQQARCKASSISSRVRARSAEAGVGILGQFGRGLAA